MSSFLEFAEGTLQEIALVVMLLVYITRIVWWFRFKAGKDRQPATGLLGTTPEKGAAFSLAIILMPWVMESNRTKPLLYAQFIIFHLGVVAAIAMSFLIPYVYHEDPTGPVWFLRAVQVAIWAAFAVGVVRIIRRLASANLRAISSPDDYFSPTLITIWFLFAALAAPNNLAAGEGIILTYFLLTAFFLIYVPFSKISHYLYYPFTRFWLGRSLGHRGSFPMKRGA